MSSFGTRDLYEVLGVPRTAAAADLKKAYRSLAQKYHPDKCPGDKAAEEKFKEAANAYQILSDDEQRLAYDRYGLDGFRRGGGGGNNGSGDPAQGFGGFNNVEDIFSAFGDLFGDFFAGRNARRPSRGIDLQLHVQLSFREAVWGTRKDVEVVRNAACDACRATGAAKGAKPEICRNCQGKGQVTIPQGYFMVQTTCAQCHGAGKLIKDPCHDCRGRGVKSETSTLNVAVPAGVNEGQTLRVAGKGEDVPGGTPGDLYVVLHVKEDDRFTREGDDVTSEVLISYAQAVLGGEIEVDTLDDGCTGASILELRPGTQPGDEVVRRGQGIPHVGREGRGDHLIRFAIDVPRKLTPKQEKLLREFAAELGDDRQRKKRRK